MNVAEPEISQLEAAENLVHAVQELSLARDLPSVVNIVRKAARALTGSDGASFILRDGDLCHYVDEDALGPLWKGQRFPLENCASGWVMLNRQALAIPDIFQDPLIPVDAYRPTFVKSLAMVPIRHTSPIGAIGIYWAHHHQATASELKILQALANSTSVTLENVSICEQLEKRVEERTKALEAANFELESFSYSVSHDLRRPLRAMTTYLDFLQQEAGAQLGPEAQLYLKRAQATGGEMHELVDGLLRLAKITRETLVRTKFSLSTLVQEIGIILRAQNPSHQVELAVAADLEADADPALARVVLENLLANAWKFTSRTAQPRIEFGRQDSAEGPEFYVRDNGAGFDRARASKLFVPFNRFHGTSEFPGSGIGLATAHRIVTRHGGRMRAESTPDHGAAFYFTLQ